MTDFTELERGWKLAKELVVPDGGIVVVAGAFKGLVMQYMLHQYPKVGRLIGFEPQAWAVAKAHEYDLVVYAFGLLAQDELFHGYRPLHEFGNDGCSLLLAPGAIDRQPGQGRFRNIGDAWELASLEHVDLFIMNMEGYEFTLLPYMLTHDYDVDSYAVQFHLHSNTEEELEAIYMLMRHHAYMPEIDDAPTWVYWRKVYPNAKCAPYCDRSTTHKQPQECSFP